MGKRALFRPSFPFDFFLFSPFKGDEEEEKGSHHDSNLPPLVGWRGKDVRCLRIGHHHHPFASHLSYDENGGNEEALWLPFADEKALLSIIDELKRLSCLLSIFVGSCLNIPGSPHLAWGVPFRFRTPFLSTTYTLEVYRILEKRRMGWTRLTIKSQIVVPWASALLWPWEGPPSTHLAVCHSHDEGPILVPNMHLYDLWRQSNNNSHAAKFVLSRFLLFLFYFLSFI